MILTKRQQDVSDQSVSFAIVRRKCPVLEAIKPAAPGSNPDRTGMVLQDGDHGVVGESLLLRVRNETFGIETIQPVLCADPQFAFTVLKHEIDKVKKTPQIIQFRDKLPIEKSIHPAVSPHPER